jgi:anti-sigma regulatory factor (Ser/Thr protein kinase)
LGLFLVRKLVDEIRYERDGDQNHLTMVKSYRTR